MSEKGQAQLSKVALAAEFGFGPPADVNASGIAAYSKSKIDYGANDEERDRFVPPAELRAKQCFFVGDGMSEAT